MFPSTRSSRNGPASSTSQVVTVLYGLGFAGVGYLLQRRYHVELSARVLYGVGTAILPVAATLLGEDGSSVARALELTVVTASLSPLLVERLLRRALGQQRAALVYVDPASFGPNGAQPAPQPALLRLQAAGVPVVPTFPIPVNALAGRVRQNCTGLQRPLVVQVTVVQSEKECLVAHDRTTVAQRHLVLI